MSVITGNIRSVLSLLQKSIKAWLKTLFSDISKLLQRWQELAIFKSLIENEQKQQT